MRDRCTTQVVYLSCLREDGTRFAPGYTERKFDEVKLGMAPKEALHRDVRDERERNESDGGRDLGY
jgi:hypothetical protein